MADTAPNYRIWQSPETVLIQTETVSLELSVMDALALANDLAARLSPVQPKPRAEWVSQYRAECARLYIDEEMGMASIAKRLGVSGSAVRNWLVRAGVQLRTIPRREANLIKARAARAAKLAAASDRMSTPS